MPVALIIALFFIQQGTLQNLLPYTPFTSLEGAGELLPMGPVASQEAIKMLGTNGGGFFNANSSHPFENPTALTNFVQMLAIFLIPTALCFAFGDVVNDRRRGPYAAVGHVVNLRGLRSTGDVGRMVRQQPLYAAGG